MDFVKKKRGGQPKNKNAYQHGFYSGAFKARENRLLNESPAMDVTAEIELLRVLNVRYLDSISDSLHQLDPDKQLADLRAFTLSARAVGALIRIQKARAAGEKDADETLEKYASLEVDEDEDIDTAS